MEITFAKRMDSFQEGIFTVLNKKKNELLAQGRTIYNLSVGTPDFKPAPHVMQALTESASKPENYKYSLVERPALLEGLVKYWYVCRWMQGSAVKLKTYCIWWSVPAAVIAGGCLLHLQHSALAMLLAAGGTFAFGLVCELRPGGCLHGYWKGLKKKFEKT